VASVCHSEHVKLLQKKLMLFWYFSSWVDSCGSPFRGVAKRFKALGPRGMAKRFKFERHDNLGILKGGRHIIFLLSIAELNIGRGP
jgi:hypothetical protein